jgi:hypothetical protein
MDAAGSATAPGMAEPAETARAAGDRSRDADADPTHQPGQWALGCAASPRRTGETWCPWLTHTVAKHMTHRSGSRALTWRTFLRHHARALIVSGADAELSQALRALHAQVMRTLRRWLTWCATSRLPRSSRRSAATHRAPRAPASVPGGRTESAVRPLIAIESPAAYEQGTPDFQPFPHDDHLCADPPKALQMASVRLASPAVGRWGMHPRTPPQGKCHTAGQA